MIIGIITAMREEFQAVAATFTVPGTTQSGACRIDKFSFAGHEFFLMESGMGFANAARAAGSLVRDTRPDLLISAGFCGGIEPEMKVGDVVVAESIVIVNEGGCEGIPVLLTGIGQTFVTRQQSAGEQIFSGTFVSTATITSKARLAKMLSGTYMNPVVEMESGAIAIIAAENSIPLMAIRAVSDDAAEELGFLLSEFCDHDMRRIIPYKVLLTILKKPRIIPQLARLRRTSCMAAESLTAAFTSLFPTL